ncbi:MAG: 3-hydroxyacyl-CoA dehydrogenase NAD-binding domain-containing protein, partial [Leifsonia flava]
MAPGLQISSRFSKRVVLIARSSAMASGIVEVFAKAGYDVVFTGRGQDKVDVVVAAITKNFDKQIKRGRATEE